MPITRRFLVATSLSRLIRKERGSERVIEGHFPAHSDRHSHVRIENGCSHLVLTCSGNAAEAAEDWTELPRPHAISLLEVCRGKVRFERSLIRLNGCEAWVDHFNRPGALDLVSVQFATQVDAKAFVAPPWFGEEVTENKSYTNRAIALSGLPPAAETSISDTALHAFIDVIEQHRPEHRPEQAEVTLQPAGEQRSTLEMMRRPAIVPKDPAIASSAAVETSTDVNPAPHPRRPMLQGKFARIESSDERLSQVIDGLSEALLANSR